MSQVFDWTTAPLVEAQKRLADLKIIYDRAVSIVSGRQSVVHPSLHCWSQSHKTDGIVPASVLAQCKDLIPDGRWVFRDDGARANDGTMCSIVCCSQRCYMVYQQFAINEKLNRKAAE